MARRIPPAPGEAAAASSSTPTGAKPEGANLPGGAPGIMGRIPGAETKIHFPGVSEGSANASPEQPEGAPDVPKVQRYSVVNCPKPPGGPTGFRVLLNGVIAFLPDGKVVTSSTYDIEALKRQGVKLEHLGEV